MQESVNLPRGGLMTTRGWIRTALKVLLLVGVAYLLSSTFIVLVVLFGIWLTGGF